MRKISKLIIHTTASKWGNVEAVNAWHNQRGWTGIGYHKLIGNGYPTYHDLIENHYRPEFDGLIQQGRPDEKVGAHAVGANRGSLGICIVGSNDHELPTPKQWAALVDCCKRLCKRYGIPVTHILGHRETTSGKKQGKSCPGRKVNLDKLRFEVALL